MSGSRCRPSALPKSTVSAACEPEKWGRWEYRVEKPVAKLEGRHRSSVVELSIRNPARPAHASAGRCGFKELGEARDDWRWRETPPLAPPLAPRCGAGSRPFSRARGPAGLEAAAPGFGGEPPKPSEDPPTP